MWLILVACVAIVTVIARLFGLKVLIAFVAAISLLLWVVGKKLDNDKDVEE
ncbi:hypothetical protein M1512_02395 [Patescibacteria group bacterium]|nr:hypothetical protein [Patescibacteria group bacterium]